MNTNDTSLWFRGPASVWEEALPLGTGRVGAMVFGGVRTELVQLNDDRLWSGGPLCPSQGDPGVVERAHSVRNLPLADLRLDIRAGGWEAPVNAYRRRLDLRTGVHTVSYSVGDVTVLRESVCHPELHVLAMRVQTNRSGAAEVAVSLENALGGVAFSRDGAVSGLAGVTGAGGTAYAVAVGVVHDGTDAVTVYVATEAGDRGPDVEPERDPDVCADAAVGRVEAASSTGWHTLRAEAVAAHRLLFDRVHLDLGPAPDLPTDERIAAGGDDPALAALLFNFGRYLLITSSRPGTSPANLRGVRNPHVDLPWRGNRTLDINLKMTCWAAETTALPECHRPLLDFVERLAAQGGQVPKTLHGSPGSAAWSMAGAWLSLHLWEHFEFGRDCEWLRDRAWPVLRGAAEFCAAWLVEHEGTLTTAPSTLPENHYLDHRGRPVAVGVRSTMDLTLVWELFRCVASAAEVLGLQDDEVVSRTGALLRRLPPLPIGTRGQLLEWATEVPDAKPRDEGTGWSPAWKVALWARLGDRDRAGELLALFLADVTESAAPFQIDGNLGITAAIAEMLVQSHTGELSLLPALPREWRHGSVLGLRARGGIRVDLTWYEGELTAVALHGAQRNSSFTVRYRDRVAQVDVRPGLRHVLDSGLAEVALSTR